MEQAEITRRQHLPAAYVGQPLEQANTFSFDGTGKQLTKNPIVLFVGATTRCVRRTFADAGFLVAEEGDEQFNVQWGSPMPMQWMERLSPGQVTAHIAGQYCLVRKDSLAETLEKAVRRCAAFRIAPRSFSIPDQMQTFRAYGAQHPGYYVLKRATAARGEGVKIIMHDEEFKAVEAVVQEYIERPLLIDGRKFDLRVYVAVTSVNPLMAYLYQEGLGRFACQPYRPPTKQNRRDKTVHLTNYSVNKEADVELEEIKWKLSDVFRHLDEKFEGQPALMTEEYFGLPKQQMSASQIALENMKHVIRMTLIAGEPEMYSASSMSNMLGFPRKQFAFLGFDLMLMQDLTVQLIEVNVTPSTATDSQLDIEVKFPMVRDLLRLVGPVCHSHKGEPVVPKMKSLKRTQSASVGVPEFKLRPGEKKFSKYEGKRGELTRFELLSKQQMQSEMGRMGQFDMLMPDQRYLRFFEVQRSLNELGAEWVLEE